MKNKKETAVFGAGCFWHIQEEFDKLPNVETEVGYMGGDEQSFPNPDYTEVSSDRTRYIEVVKIDFKPKQVSYEELLQVFFKIHNPTTINRQGFDIGTQYKSVIFYTSKDQKEKSDDFIRKIQKNYKQRIVTEVRKAKTFFRAEEYHQKYYSKNKEMVCRV